jgi:hypothetical protein
LDNVPAVVEKILVVSRCQPRALDNVSAVVQKILMVSGCRPRREAAAANPRPDAPGGVQTRGPAPTRRWYERH